MCRLREVLRFIWSHPLNHHDRIGAVVRFLRWQLAARLAPGPVALPFVQGTRLLTSPGMTGASGNYYCGLHEPAEMALVLHLLRPDDLFVDVGANVGSYTVLAAGAVGARVIAIEPLPSTFANLRRNVGVNLLDGRVRLLPCGLAAAAGELAFTTGGDTVNHVTAAADPSAVTVRVRTLDDVCDGETPAIVKIDVEGFEHEVVAGGARTLRLPGLLAVLMETNGSGTRYGQDDGALHARMRDLGFAATGYDPLSRRLTPAVKGSFNTIYVRDPAAIEARLRTAPQFELSNGRI